MKLLAFDTSTEVLAVAAAGPQGACTWNGPGGALASTQLVPQVRAVLARAGLALADVQAVAFGRGPGAFTGLRTSCAVAQGLGLGLGCPLLPLDSLLLVADDALAQGASARASQQAGAPASLPAEEPVHVAVAMDARMDEIYGGIYRRSATGWQPAREAALYALADWNTVLEQEAGLLRWLAGSALVAFGARLHRPPGVQTLPSEHDRAAALLRLARQAFSAGAGIDAAQALPLYLRDKVALTTAERAEARAQADGATERAAGAATTHADAQGAAATGAGRPLRRNGAGPAA